MFLVANAHNTLEAQLCELNVSVGYQVQVYDLLLSQEGLNVILLPL